MSKKREVRGPTPFSTESRASTGWEREIENQDPRVPRSKATHPHRAHPLCKTACWPCRPCAESVCAAARCCKRTLRPRSAIPLPIPIPTRHSGQLLFVSKPTPQLPPNPSNPSSPFQRPASGFLLVKTRLFASRLSRGSCRCRLRLRPFFGTLAADLELLPHALHVLLMLGAGLERCSLAPHPNPHPLPRIDPTSPIPANPSDPSGSQP